MLDAKRVVFRDGTGVVRMTTVTNWEKYLTDCMEDGYEPQAVELCRVANREEAMRFVNLTKESTDE